MGSQQKAILESKVRFSESMMWGAQKAYYDEKGIDAWTEDVPNYITSNPFIGRSYAQVMIAFMQDWMNQHPECASEPFYILELGTGTGQFSFYLLKNLIAYKEMLGLENLNIRYVMSDVTTRPFDFWSNHPALQPYLNQGVLDFATFDLYHDTVINLSRAKKTVDAKAIKNPLIVVANYLFDSISTDVFTVNNGEIFEALVTVKTDDALEENGQPTDWEQASISYDNVPIAKPYYGNEFDEVLFAYQDQLMDSHFQFPIAGLKALKNLQTLSGNRLLLVTSDKGYTTLNELDCLEYPDLDFHGCFSVMVNYHAIGEYLVRHGGDQHIQAFRDNIVTGIFSSGFELKGLPQLKLATSQVVDGFSPTDYFLMYEYIEKHYKEASFAQLSTFLNLSDWDPHLYEHISSHLADLAEDGDPEVVAYLVENIHKIAENFYFTPSATDALFDIGVFFQNVNHFLEAIDFYQQSNRLFGESDITWFNIGICYHSMHHKAEALKALKRALELNEDAYDAQHWLETIEAEIV